MSDILTKKSLIAKSVQLGIGILITATCSVIKPTVGAGALTQAAHLAPLKKS